MKASQQAIERGVKDCVFIDYKRRSGHFDVTTVASIKEIIEKVKYSAACQRKGNFPEDASDDSLIQNLILHFLLVVVLD